MSVAGGEGRRVLAIARALARTSPKLWFFAALFPLTWLALVAMDTLRDSPNAHFAVIGFFGIPVAMWWATVRRRLPELVGSLRALAMPTPWRAFAGALVLHVVVLIVAAGVLAPSVATLPWVVAAFVAIAGLMVEWPGRTLAAIIALLVMRKAGLLDGIAMPPLPLLFTTAALVGATGLARTALRVRAATRDHGPAPDRLRAPDIEDDDARLRDDAGARDDAANGDGDTVGSGHARGVATPRRDATPAASSPRTQPPMARIGAALGWPADALPRAAVVIAILLPVVAWGVATLVGSSRAAGPIGFAAAFLVVLFGLFGATGRAITSLDAFGENREALRLLPLAPQGVVLTHAFLAAWWRHLAAIAVAVAPGGALLAIAVGVARTPATVLGVLAGYAAVALACMACVALVVVVGRSRVRRVLAALGMIAVVACAIVLPSAPSPVPALATIAAPGIAIALMAAARRLPLPPPKRAAMGTILDD